MRILITQGHEKGVGLEVFIKSFILSKSITQEACILYVYQETLKEHLSLLKIPFEIKNDGVNLGSKFLKCQFLKKSSLPQSSESIEVALNDIEENETLFTLPTSKDQIIHPFDKSRSVAGHTEYLRIKFNNKHLGMFFKADDLNVLLLTDHLPLKDIPSILSQKNIFEKSKMCLNYFDQFNFNFKKIYFSGINPHAGENGLLGNEDNQITGAINQLKSEFNKKEFIGPLSGDTLIFSHKDNADLFIYSFHDQGLSVFKSLKKTYGANITIGLPFHRISVDHGTAFSLFGKNVANPMGALYCLENYFILDHYGFYSD